MKSNLILITAACIALTACGTTQKDRTLGGASVGAAAGAAVGAVTSLSVLEGAAIGAAVGAVTGAVTDPSQINLGRPPWTKPESGSASKSGSVKAIQTGLQKRGLYAGPIDGIAGPKTTAGIREYQRQNGLLVDGRATPELAAHIERNM